MEPDTSKSQSTWIVVLAVAIACCAGLFVVFANYLKSVNQSLASVNTELLVLQTDENRLLQEIMMLRKLEITNGVAVTANPAKVVPPAATVPATPAPAATAPAPAQAPAAAPAPAAPATNK